MKSLDFEKTIFVIDRPAIALMVSLIAKGNSVKCIFEKKVGNDDDYTMGLLKNFSHACISIKEEEEVEVPEPYFFTREKGLKHLLKSLIKFRKDVRSKHKEKIGYTYVGPMTSSIMNVLSDKCKDRRMLYHGTGDYRPALKKEKFNVMKAGKKLLKRIIYEFIGLGNSWWVRKDLLPGYSMCDLRSPEVEWLDCSHFQSPQIENVLLQIKKNLKSRKSIILCPRTDIHTKEGVDSDTTKFNEVNINMLELAGFHDKDVYIKFHPLLYHFGNTAIINLTKEIAEHFGVDAYDVSSIIPDSIGGVLIPLEVLVKYLNFEEIVCLETSAVWNLEKCEVKKTLCNCEIDEGRLPWLNDVMNVMRNAGIVNETYRIIGFKGGYS